MSFLSRQERFLAALWRLVARAPQAIVWSATLLGVAAALISVLFLRLDSDQDKLVSQDVAYQQRYLEVLKNFGDQEYLYIVIKAGEDVAARRTAERFADRVADRLTDHPELIEEIHYRMTPRDLGPGALYFASLEEVEHLTGMVETLGPPAAGWLRGGRLPDLLHLVADLLSGGGEADPAMLAPAMDGREGFLQRLDGTLAGTSYDGPVFDLTGGGGHYFFTGNHRLLIMRVLPHKDYGTMDVIAAPLDAVRRALTDTRTEFPEVQAGLTGRPVLQADEMATTNRDMNRASIIAVVLVGLLFTVVLHGWLRPLLVIFSLALAIAWTFGFVTLTVGVLNLLSIVFALVLVGIGVDFGVHIVMRYVEERQAGQKVEESVRRALVLTGPGLLLGAATSVCAFYSVVGSDFTGLAELGLIGGTGILLCLLAMLTVLPSLLLLAGRKNLFPRSAPQVMAMPLLGRLSARPGRLLGILAVVTLLLLPGLFKVRFSYNLLELQAKGLESVRYERYMIEESDESTWYAIAMADDLARLDALRDRFKALPSVGKIESLSDYLPRDQARKVALFRHAATKLEVLPAAPASVGKVEAAAMIAALDRLEQAFENLAEKLFAAGAGPELARLDGVLDTIASARARLQQTPALAARLGPLQERVERDIAVALRQLRTWLAAPPVTAALLPASLRDLFVGRDGRIQLKLVPREDIWQFDNLRRFVDDLRRVDPGVSGVPISVYESARLMKRTFLSAAVVTLFLVSFLLWFHARSRRYVLLALTPLAFGMVWLLSLMGWLGIDFNLANFFAIPILIAIGVDGGVHFLARWRHLGNNCLFSTSTPMAVTLSFATTMIGFGGLLFAHHRGLASLGGVMVLGSLTGLLSCLLVLPAVLKYCRYGRTKDGKENQ
jgi:hypothetical protein